MNLHQEILELLVEFGGGQGGRPGPVAIRFLLPAFFWTILAVVAFREAHRTRNVKDRYIGIAAITGIARELLMFIAEYGSLRGFVSFGALYPFYPPFEHAATTLSGIFIAAAFMNYLLQWRTFSRRYFLASTALSLIFYAATAVLWPVFLRDHPGAAFGSFWGDMLYRTAAAAFMGTALAVFLYGKTRGARVQTALLMGFTFLFLDEILMIFNLATGERHVGVYAPIRHNLHIWAIPLFLGVYWSDLQNSLQKALQLIQHERSRSEAIIAAMGDGITIQDRNFRILYQNKIQKDMAGGDFSGQLCYRVYEQRETVCEGCPMARSMADGRVHRAERTLYGGNGIAHFEITASPLRDSKGQIIAGIEVVRDITEKKRLDEETAKSQRLESLGLLAGGLAHDFNNLLTGIFGNIGLAKRHVGSGTARDILDEAEQASLRAAELTRQLLTFAKGGAPVRKTEAIMDIIREAVPFALSGSNVKAQFEACDEVHQVDVDAGQVSRVFNNLTLNAVQAMPDGGTLTITVNNVTIGNQGPPSDLAPGDYVRVSVADTGVGIPHAVLPKIFDPYFTTREKGHGLGLATVYSIMKKHRGGITVESGRGPGTTFHLYFPRSEGKEAPADDRTETVKFGSGHVLVMDDEQPVRHTAGEILKFLGYTCSFASDGAEAVRLYRQAKGTENPFDLIIMDLTVPGGVGGREAIQKLREVDPDVLAIVSSGYSSDPVLQEYERYGFAGMIEKPFGVETLGRAIHDALATVNRRR